MTSKSHSYIAGTPCSVHANRCAKSPRSSVHVLTILENLEGEKLEKILS